MNPLLALILIVSVSEVFSEKKVLVLSFDGFRSDYYHENKTPKLWAVRNKSTAPKYLKSIFPPKTMATLHSLSTGVYPDKHGVYANEMFDNRGGVKQYKNNHFDDLNPDIVPIWIENQTKGGGKSGLMMWPGGEFQYGSEEIPLHQVYNEATSWENRAQTIIKWTHVDKCNLVMAYFEDKPYYRLSELDILVQSHITKVDEIIEKIRNGIPNEYDLIILSDHGTSKVPGTNVIDINSLVDNSTVQKIVSGPLVFVKVPIYSTRRAMYNRLKTQETQPGTYKVYDKEHFQNDWYIKDLTALSSVLIIVAEPTYTFMVNEDFDELLTSQGLTKEQFVILENGYDNDVEDMRALFIGIGPGFKDDEYSEEFLKLIDVYPCLKALLLLKGDASTFQTQNALSTVMKQLLETSIVTAYES